MGGPVIIARRKGKSNLVSNGVGHGVILSLSIPIHTTYHKEHVPKSDVLDLESADTYAMATVQSLLGLRLSSPVIAEYIASIAPNVSIANATVPEVKSYSDAVYLNYFVLGLSLHFAPQGGYKPTSVSKLSDLNSEKLVLESIDMYSALPGLPSKSQPAFATFAALPVALSLAEDIKNKEGLIIKRQANILVSTDSTGKDFVAALHEPDRKGGGAGPSTGSIGIWCEWTMDGIMVEFGGEEAKGPQAWERGKDARWRVLTTFKPDQALH